MVYYHVYISFIDDEGKRTSSFLYNLTEGIVRERFAASYMKNEAFMLGGIVYHPSQIRQIGIYSSEESYLDWVFPSNKSPLHVLSDAINKYILRGEVKGIDICTGIFITSPPQVKEGVKRAPTRSLETRKKVFVVHGRDDKPALVLQKYLRDKLRIDAVVFDDLPDKGRTIIEQLEYIQKNVRYAFVIVTPDDLGCLREEVTKMTRKTAAKILERLETRARQNVVFELGLFIGTLGRKRVCCLLKKGTEERPSDIDGILYKSFNKTVREIFHEIAEEMK